MSAFSFTEDQAYAVHHSSGPLLVSAGAGSGKTRVLVERIVNALCGVGGEQNKTGESSFGIDRILTITFTNKAANELKERVAHELRLRGRWDIASRIEEMWISTIHGMCSRILKAHALECGLSPFFALADEIQSENLRIEAFQKAITEYGELFQNRSSDESDSDYPVLGQLPEESILARYEYQDLYRGASTLLPYIAGDVALEAHIDRENVEGVALASYSDGFIELANRFARAYQEAKDARGLVDYDDLEHKTKELLTSDATVREFYQNKFETVQIDEFQDTNAMQLELIGLLSKQGLYSVGDAQQSIYRFRGADVEAYQTYSYRLEERAKVNLVQNFRSHEQILMLCNEVFRECTLFEGMFLELEAGRSEALREQKFSLPSHIDRVNIDLYGRVPRKSANATTLHAMHARKMTHQIKELLDHEAVTTGDIVILLRSSKNMKLYLNELIDAGIEAVISGGGAFFEEPVVGVFEHLSRVLANPQDEQSLLTVLSSQMFRVSDEALYAIMSTRKSGQTLYDCMCEQTQTDEPPVLQGQNHHDIRLAYRVLSDALGRLGRDDLSTILEDIVQRSGFDLCLLGQGPQGEQQYAFVLKMLQMADAFERGTATGAASFAQMLRQNRTLNSKEGLSSLPCEGVDPVRIMTIHASKGLEFPIVFVPELESAVVKSSKDLVRVDNEVNPAQVVVTLPASERTRGYEAPALFDDLKKQDEEAEAREFARLLYVALTRTQDAVYLAGCPPASITSGKTADMLGSAFFETFVNGAMEFPDIPESGTLKNKYSLHLGEREVVCSLHSVSPSVEVDTVTPRIEVQESRDKESCVVPLPEAQADPMTSRDISPYLPTRISYSGFSAYNECSLRFEAERLYHVGELSLKEDREEATSFGSAFHALAELYARGEDLSQQRVKQVATYHDVDASVVPRVTEALDRWATSDIAQGLFTHGTPKPEVPFAIKLEDEIGSITLDGSIDLMANDGTHATVIDYKTGLAREQDTEVVLRDRYRLQAECYSLAPLRGGFETVDIVFVRPEVEVVDAEGATSMQTVTFSFSQEDCVRIEGELREIYHKIQRGLFEPLTSYRHEVCDSCPIKGTLCKVG